MDAAKLLPALPWAASAGTSEAGPEGHDGELRPVALEAVGLKLGCRIEVKWMVHEEGNEEGEDAHTRWWGATVCSACSSAGSATGDKGTAVPAYQLKYDAYAGFDEEIGTVEFLSDHVLKDTQQEAPLMWREEGDAWDESEEEGSEDGEGDEATLSTAELLRRVGPAPPEGALAPEEASLLEGLDAVQRAFVATGYREMCDAFKGFLEAKADEGDGAGGARVTVTQADVQEFTTMLKSMRAKQRERLGLGRL